MRMMVALWLGTLAALTGTPAAGAEPKIAAYTGDWVYGFRIVPPWPEGGELLVKLPEHLHHKAGRIINYNEEKPKGAWQVAEGGRSATLDVESFRTPHVRVQATARVVSGERIDLDWRITNGSRLALQDILPLFCHQYRHLAGFPQYTDNYKHTYVICDGKVVALSRVATSQPATQVKGAQVRTVPEDNNTGFARNQGGLIEEGVEAAIMGVTSLDGKRALVAAWKPGKSILSNAQIPCIHADPRFGTIPAGESAGARGVIVFTDRPVEKVMLELLEEGYGKPVWPATQPATATQRARP